MTEPESLTWACACGHHPWIHYDHCPLCGRQRPEPEQKPPSHEPLAEPLACNATLRSTPPRRLGAIAQSARASTVLHNRWRYGSSDAENVAATSVTSDSNTPENDEAASTEADPA